MPQITGIFTCSMRLRNRSSRSRSNTGCVTTYSAPASTFNSNRRISSSRFSAPGIGADADQQRGLRSHRIAADIEPVIQVVHDVDQADRIHVEHGRGFGIGAHARRIAGDADQVANAGGVRAEQFRLDAEDVAVAAAEVVHRLDAGVLLNQLAGHLRAHAGAGARTVRHVDAVDAVLGAEPGAGDFLRRVDAARRQNLDKRHESCRRPASRRAWTSRRRAPA